MPHDSTVRDWDDADAAISLAIARARESGEEWLAAECLQIADTPMLGVIEKLEQVKVAGSEDEGEDAVPRYELQVTERKVEDMLGHRKLQIETRLKLLAKWNPKKYGDRQILEHDVVGNLADDLKAARERAANR